MPVTSVSVRKTNAARDHAEQQLLEREQRRQAGEGTRALLVQPALDQRHQRGVQQRDDEQAVGDHREREVQLELGGLRVRAG